MTPKKHIVIIGGGAAGLSAACLLGQTQKFEITLLEKNDYLGGRMGLVEKDGFRFDKGPSWYLMPDVFNHFFELLGEKTENHLNLTKLDPSYRIFFETENLSYDLKSNPEYVASLFESLEKGAGANFIKYLKESERTYNLAIQNFIYKNYNSPKDFFGKIDLNNLPSPSLLRSMHSYIKKYFKNEKIIQILEYQLVFLGSSPYKAPALYNIMNHIDFNQGVFYPEGGLFEISKTLHKLATSRGCNLRTNSEVTKIFCKDGTASEVHLRSGEKIQADIVVSAADIHHTETKLLDSEHRDHSDSYWEKRVLAPSAHIMYLGVNKKIPKFTHHNLIFAKEWEKNFDEIFKQHELSSNPSVYICAPSVTDKTVAPEGKENLFVLTPISPKVEMSEATVKQYGDQILNFIEKETGTKFQEEIIFRQDYSTKNFSADYNTIGGSALGLAHTLNQSLLWRPHNKSKKVQNLFYTGQTTNPGIGVPMQLIGAELLVKLIFNLKNDGHPLQNLPS